MENGQIPVVDIFAGPGGLGEGFSSLPVRKGQQNFKICLSIEKEPNAHATLELRSFFRQFSRENVPDEYYRHLRGEISRPDLYNLYHSETDSAFREAWCATLGEEPPEYIDKRINASLNDSKSWVLIGGPPCQAYSTVGRSRLGGINPEDPRVYLYREYLRIIACHTPPVFVMENVKGLLSSKVNGSLIFNQILNDLRKPDKAVRKLKGNTKQKSKDVSYKIFSFTKNPKYIDLFGMPEYKPRDFIIQCEHFRIPQARHRVILLGIRDDLNITSPEQLKVYPRPVAVGKVLGSLPRLRSGLSRETDTKEAWHNRLKSALHEGWFAEIQNNGQLEVAEKLREVLNNLRKPHKDRGGHFVDSKKIIKFQQQWYHDSRLKGACNHSSRAHMVSDLHRYLYAACFAKVHGRTPFIRDFPSGLNPAHKNIRTALKSNIFSDRFRVQVASRPATTVTSHIAKDGHYYIHPDPSQCRALTVREAARLQTFPDNYFFCGNRSQQYVQVGNAVPPLLARQIAEVVLNMFRHIGLAD